MIPPVSAWHEDHVPTRRTVEERLARDERLMVSGPGIVASDGIVIVEPQEARGADSPERPGRSYA
jgi:hypothetical protein